MNSLNFSMLLLLAATTSCGRPASDIVHASTNPDTTNLDTSGPGDPENDTSKCGENQIPLTRPNNSTVCVKEPEARNLSAVSLLTFWNSSTATRCQDLFSFVNAFQRAHMPLQSVSLNTCRPISQNSMAIFVSFSVAGNGPLYTEAFEIAAAPNTSSIIRICTRERTHHVENAHCNEIFRPNRIPAALAAVAPNPSEALIDFYPTLWTLLSN
jgi:hypothetical protein